MRKPFSGRFVSARVIASGLTVVLCAIGCIQRTALSAPTITGIGVIEDYVKPSPGPGQPQQLAYDLPNSDFNFSNSAIPGGISLTGTLSTYAADQQAFYDSITSHLLRFNIYGQGELNAGDVVTVHYNFDFTFPEGTVTGVSIGTSGETSGGGGATIGSVISGEVISGQFAEPPAATSESINPQGFDQLTINFTFTSVKATDPLTLTIPSGSIDVTVPEPATASIVFFSALALALRRRR